MRLEDRHVPIEGTDRGKHERLLCEVASIRHEIPRREVVRSICHDVIAPNDFERIRSRQSLSVGFDPHMRIEPLHRFARALHFRHAHMRSVVSHLPLEVVE